jgi:hypothetical protein
MKKILFTIIFVLGFYNCSKEESGTASSTDTEQTSNTETETETETTPEIVQYTLTVNTAAGGTVSTEGGTYDEGTEVKVTANASEGYQFAGWEGSQESSNAITLTLTANLKIKPIFELVEVEESLYVAGALIEDNTISALFDRSLTVNGMKIVVAGAAGGQIAVPDFWAKKIARLIQLMTDPTYEGIDAEAQKNMIKTLKGATGTWHEGYPTIQRIAYGGGDDYSPNWLRDKGIGSYEGLQEFNDTHSHNDMVWYRNSSGDSFDIGDNDFQEVMEHIMHTMHLFGVPGGVEGSKEALFLEAFENPNWNSTPLHLAMKEAIDSGMYAPDYAPEWDQLEDAAAVAYKEYLYLLNFNMWEMSEFWEGQSLAPEWNDVMRTPDGILTNNPLGYELFNNYIKPVLSKPDFTIIRSIFQDNDQGESGYVAD